MIFQIAKGPDPPAVPLPGTSDLAQGTGGPPSAADSPATAPIANTAMCVWTYQGSARLLYQDSTGDVREACANTQWKTNALQLKPSAKMNTPLVICSWGDEVWINI